jgi:hypothetical protein
VCPWCPPVTILMWDPLGVLLLIHGLSGRRWHVATIVGADSRAWNDGWNRNRWTENRAPDSNEKRRRSEHDMDYPLAIVVSVVALLGAGAAIFTAWTVAQAWIYVGLFGPGLERDLGFRDDKAILPTSNVFGYISAVAVKSVIAESPFARAGIRSGDVLSDESHISLFKKLHHHRGETVELAIVDGGSGPPFHERPRRVVRVLVPPRHERSDTGQS